jgi:hypothetical protein
VQGFEEVGFGNHGLGLDRQTAKRKA